MNLGRQTQTLQFPGRKGRRAPIQRQIAQAQIEQHLDPSPKVLGDLLGDQRLFRVLDSHVRQTRGLGVGIRIQMFL